LTSPDSPIYHPLMKPFIIGEMTANAGLYIFLIYLTIIFFKKKKAVPKTYIVFLITTLAVLILDSIVMEFIPVLSNEASVNNVEIAKAVISAAIWIPYFIKSVRVKNTFVV
jgi:hypothetical protein